METLKQELKENIVEQLNLEDITVKDIDDKDILFGDGLGLDSIDALELIVMLDKNYGIKLTDPKEGRAIFESIEVMAKYILFKNLSLGITRCTPKSRNFSILEINPHLWEKNLFSR